MSNENENREPRLEEGSGTTGLIIVLIFLLGLPLLGILYTIFFKEPPG